MNATGTGTAREARKSTVTKPQLRVLLVEDDPADRDLILRELGKGEFEIISDVAATADEFRQRIRTNCPDVVLADYNLGKWRGTEALEILREEGLDIPLILVSGALGDVTAVECIKQGVTDYVLKDSLARLPVALRGALKDKNSREDRKRNQEALAQKVEELARSNADLQQFAYVASHDLQEPLRMVSAYTQLLGDRYRGQLDEQADKYISYAVDGAVRMQSLIQDLLAFSRVGRQETLITRTACNEIVEQAITDLRAAIQESGAVVTHGPLPTLMANGSQLKQVFQNLIGNALKFRGSQIPLIQISAERQGSNWIFSVADNGIGISAEHTENVFIIFNRLHTRTEYPGNGIGLAICKKIVERHGGRIEALPNDSGGTIFRFLCRREDFRRTGSRVRATTWEILLVDDNPADLDLTIDAFKQSALRGNVNTVSDGVEAMAYLRREGKYGVATRPHLVLLDLNLPRKDGRSVLTALKSDPTLRRIPVVIFSTSQAAKDIERSYDLGANSYVSKPPTLDEWIGAVKLINDFWIGCACLPREEEQ